MRVACICLTADRQQQTDRAVRSFLAQTYRGQSELVIVDSGDAPYSLPLCGGTDRQDVCLYRCTRDPFVTLGHLRNLANGCTHSQADIILHWDSDDWSHPERIKQQVVHLVEESNCKAPAYRGKSAECVGYSELLIWDEMAQESWWYHSDRLALPGTSLAYWRTIWQCWPFPLIDRGEDTLWQRGLRVASMPGMIGDEPAMIATCHAGNNMRVMRDSAQWKRSPEWDAYCKEKLAL